MHYILNDQVSLGCHDGRHLLPLPVVLLKFFPVVWRRSNFSAPDSRVNWERFDVDNRSSESVDQRGGNSRQIFSRDVREQPKRSSTFFVIALTRRGRHLRHYSGDDRKNVKPICASTAQYGGKVNSKVVLYFFIKKYRLCFIA